jgi:hypothetical protein
MISLGQIARPAWLVLAIGAAIAAAAVTPSVAQAADCGSRTLTQPFSRFGDSNQYFLAPGASFESGTSGWSLSNAAVVTGNNSYFLRSSADTKSLRITGSATSPRFCITRDDPLVRFAAKSTKIAGSTGNYSSLHVTAVIRNSSGSVMSYYLGSLAAPSNSNWFVSSQLSWGQAFDAWLFEATGTATIELEFKVQGQGGTWNVDDVFVDPFRGT